jgi:hypothetical protein
MMILTEDQVKELDNFIAEMPLKYGLPLLQFFNKIHEEQKESDVVKTQLELSKIESKNKK